MPGDGEAAVARRRAVECPLRGAPPVWEEVAVVANEPLAGLIQELLEAEGIPVLLQPLGAGPMYPAGPEGWRVMVPVDQAASARDLLGGTA